MNFEFIKMQACGNDFVVIDARLKSIELSKNLIQKIADRHFGIGCDSILVLRPAINPDADAFYYVYNADGSESAQCGNGARCIAQFLHKQNEGKKSTFILETLEQPISLEIIETGLIKAALAIPTFDANLLPIELPSQVEKNLARYEFELNNKKIIFYGVSLGNPHAVTFVDDLENASVNEFGVAMNKHAGFPEGINVSFVKLDEHQSIKARVYERGVGETLACGSGACASALVCGQLNKISSPVQVLLPGGTVQIDWQDFTKPVTLTGPSEFVFSGVW